MSKGSNAAKAEIIGYAPAGSDKGPRCGLVACLPAGAVYGPGKHGSVAVYRSVGTIGPCAVCGAAAVFRVGDEPELPSLPNAEFELNLQNLPRATNEQHAAHILSELLSLPDE